MCIAAIIQKPVTLDDLRNMEAANKDGAGVAWLDDSAANGVPTIRFVRGLKAEDIFKMQEVGTMSYPYLLHFRYATVGAEDHTNVHPFPMGEQALLGERTGECSSVMMHNGTWSGYNHYIKKAWEDGYQIPDQAQLDAMSDTAVAAWLAPAYPKILDEVRWATAVAYVDGDTLAIEQRGTWSEHEGNLYSNLHWLPWSGSHFEHNREFWKKYAKSKGWDWLDDSDSAPVVTIPTPDELVAPRWDASDEAWQAYLAAKYGLTEREELTIAERMYGEAERELEETEVEQIDAALAEELGVMAHPDELISEDPEAVNSWLAERMIG